MSKNIYVSLFACMVLGLNCMEPIDEIVSPTGQRERAAAEQPILAEQGTIERLLPLDIRMLAMQAKKRIAEAQDAHIMGQIQALRAGTCMHEQNADWHVAVPGDTELHAALRKKDGDLLQVLLQKSEARDINSCNARGDTPILLVSQMGDYRNALCTLLRYPNCDVNVKNNAGYPALYYAAKMNCSACIKALIKRGAMVKFVDTDGNGLLHIAAEADASFSIEALAAYGLDPNQLNKKGLSPLHIALLKNHKWSALSILQYYTQVNPNILLAGENPLLFAIRSCSLEVIRSLVAKEADVNAKDAMGNRALDLALTREDSVAIIDQLVKYGVNPDTKDIDGMMPLMYAIKNRDIDMVMSLIGAGANPNLPDANGAMPLMYAVKNRDAEMVMSLIGAGANPNLPDVKGAMPLMYAVKNRDAEMVRTLLFHKANPNSKDANGDTPLSYAIKNKDMEIVGTLIESGADPDMPGSDGVLPIFALMQIDNPDYVRSLIKKGANVFVRDAEGNTPLHFAVRFDSLTHLLLERGVHANEVNKKGNTPLHCVKNTMTPISAYLLRCCGADVNIKNKAGFTPYKKALRYCKRRRPLDGRILDILENKALVCARDYGIIVDHFPGMSNTTVMREHDSRVEQLDDGSDGHVEAAAPAAQQKEGLLTRLVCAGWQQSMDTFKHVTHCLCPRAQVTVAQGDSVQPAAGLAESVPAEGEAVLPSSAIVPQCSKRHSSTFDADNTKRGMYGPATRTMGDMRGAPSFLGTCQP